jgi:hypothetical protein
LPFGYTTLRWIEVHGARLSLEENRDWIKEGFMEGLTISKSKHQTVSSKGAFARLMSVVLKALNEPPSEPKNAWRGDFRFLMLDPAPQHPSRKAHSS